jgi:hypothetical protein
LRKLYDRDALSGDRPLVPRGVAMARLTRARRTLCRASRVVDADLLYRRVLRTTTESRPKAALSVNFPAVGSWMLVTARNLPV